MRELVLGNGNILLCLDGDLCLRDFYHPFVGMYNHVGGQKCRLGVWVDNHFQWVSHPLWQIQPGYVPGSLVSDSAASNSALGLRLRVREGIHFRENLYLRRITIQNQQASPREVRLYLAHDFSIHETPDADTALLDPATRGIIHYERDTYFLMNGASRHGGVSEFATGIKGIGWAEGTWRDAEDGHLQGNPIAQGSVDSTIAFHVTLPAGGEETIDTWIVVGESLETVRRADERVRRQSVEQLLEETDAFWRSWVGHKAIDFGDLPVEVVDLFQRSLLIMRAQIDNRGGVIAATDSEHLYAHRDTYRYTWPRDGAIASFGLDKVGYREITRRFFQFCAEGLSGEGYLWHKYFADGAIGPTWLPWLAEGKAELPVPEDATGLVLHAFWHHYLQYRDIEFAETLYQRLVRPAADFLDRHRDPNTHLPLPSWDLWEERRGIFAFTAAAVNAGLTAAASFARLLGAVDEATRYARAAVEVRTAVEVHFYRDDLNRFIRMLAPREDGTFLPDPTLDSSLVGLWAFGMLPADDARVVRTMEAVREGLRIQTEVGGIARYVGDPSWRQGTDTTVVPGNPWFLSTLWLCQWQIARAHSFADLREARSGLDWVCRHATRAGLLPEQIHPYTGQPLSVCPLTASHSAYVTTVLAYLEKLAHLRRHGETTNGSGVPERVHVVETAKRE